MSKHSKMSVLDKHCINVNFMCIKVLIIKYSKTMFIEPLECLDFKNFRQGSNSGNRGNILDSVGIYGSFGKKPL